MCLYRNFLSRYFNFTQFKSYVRRTHIVLLEINLQPLSSLHVTTAANYIKQKRYYDAVVNAMWWYLFSYFVCFFLKRQQYDIVKSFSTPLHSHPPYSSLPLTLSPSLPLYPYFSSSFSYVISRNVFRKLPHSNIFTKHRPHVKLALLLSILFLAYLHTKAH